MATLQEILEKAGTLENAERMARFLSDNDPEYLMAISGQVPFTRKKIVSHSQ